MFLIFIFLLLTVWPLYKRSLFSFICILSSLLLLCVRSLYTIFSNLSEALDTFLIPYSLLLEIFVVTWSLLMHSDHMPQPLQLYCN